MVQLIDREQLGFIVGTVNATIAAAPVNYSILIYGFRYIDPAVAVGTVSGILMNARLGTILGTVDVFSIQPGQNTRDQMRRDPQLKLEAGQQLVGLVTSGVGSIQGVMVYAYAPGRVTGGGL